MLYGLIMNSWMCGFSWTSCKNWKLSALFVMRVKIVSVCECELCGAAHKTTGKAEKLCKYLKNRKISLSHIRKARRRREEEFFVCSIYLILTNVCDWDYYWCNITLNMGEVFLLLIIIFQLEMVHKYLQFHHHAMNFIFFYWILWEKANTFFFDLYDQRMLELCQ